MKMHVNQDDNRSITFRHNLLVSFSFVELYPLSTWCEQSPLKGNFACDSIEVFCLVYAEKEEAPHLLTGYLDTNTDNVLN